ncbi:uncharacterized protein LOC131245562 [Magnolia sinica]|uniref:uncharacterized protein LOC131245562 n=1 Tax=Magnolia sinica TaxID=86752 RepID=UPI00265AAC37|nr:uncharacterized protein LOC131245562 [Magnolia sinica]
MSSQDIEKYRQAAEIYQGSAPCKKKSIELLEEMSLPKGILPLDDMIEIGHNRSAGFIWIRQKKKYEHVFRKIGRKVLYEAEITGFIQNRRMWKITGVKTKELLIWVSASEMYIEESAPEKLMVKGPAGLRMNFPVSAFELEENKMEIKK